jgi:conjugative transposon TraN protein
MKKITTTIFLILVSLGLIAQATNLSKASFIDSYTLEVTTNKTTNLIFPSSITSIDRGSADILVQKATGVENILKVKADVKDFSETNLSVITADGKLYSFIVTYSSHPSHLNINLGKVADSNVIVPEKRSVAMYADSVLSMGSNIRPVHYGNSKMKFALNALYIHDDIMFLQFVFTNNSNINYDIDQLHLYIRDKVKTERTASQELEINPLLIIGDTTIIHANAEQTWVAALQKFTIPDGKYLSIEIMEKNGGRNLSMKVKNRIIMKATPI